MENQSREGTSFTSSLGGSGFPPIFVGAYFLFYARTLYFYLGGFLIISQFPTLACLMESPPYFGSPFEKLPLHDLRISINKWISWFLVRQQLYHLKTSKKKNVTLCTKSSIHFCHVPFLSDVNFDWHVFLFKHPHSPHSLLYPCYVKFVLPSQILDSLSSFYFAYSNTHNFSASSRINI